MYGYTNTAVGSFLGTIDIVFQFGYLFPLEQIAFGPILRDRSQQIEYIVDSFSVIVMADRNEKFNTPSEKLYDSRLTKSTRLCF